MSHIAWPAGGSSRAISHLQTVAFYNSVWKWRRCAGRVSCFNPFIMHLKTVKMFIERSQIKFCKTLQYVCMFKFEPTTLYDARLIMCKTKRSLMSSTPSGKLPQTAVFLATSILISHVQLVSSSLYPQGICVSLKYCRKMRISTLKRAKAAFVMIANKSRRHGRGGKGWSCFLPPCKNWQCRVPTWELNVGLILIFYKIIGGGKSHANSLKYPNSKLQAATAKMKGITNAKSLHSFVNC